jgi:hypothetical protein
MCFQRDLFLNLLHELFSFHVPCRIVLAHFLIGTKCPIFLHSSPIGQKLLFCRHPSVIFSSS